MNQEELIRFLNEENLRLTGQVTGVRQTLDFVRERAEFYQNETDPDGFARHLVYSLVARCLEQDLEVEQ